MSFSGKAKTELCKKNIHRPCCVRAACYGFALFSRYLDEKGLVLQTERTMVAQTVQRLFRRLGLRGEVVTKQRTESVIYEFAIKDPDEVAMLLMTFGLSGQERQLRLNPSFFVCDDCFFHFLGAAFLSCGTVADPAKEYSLEFASSRHAAIEDLGEQLRLRGFEPGSAERKNALLLYFKSSEQVEDLLTAMGATSASLEVMDRKVYKELRNKANRIANCESANIDKIVAASGSALEAVRILKEHQRFAALPRELREVAELREQYPEYSLSELGQLLSPPLSRAGVCHRIKKLTALAQQITHSTSKDKEE